MEKSPIRFLKDSKTFLPNSLTLPCETHEEEAQLSMQGVLFNTSLQLQLHR